MARPHSSFAAGLAVSLALALALLLVLVTAARASAAIEIKPGPDTVKTAKFEWDFGDEGANPEQVNSVRWRDSKEVLGANLAADNGGINGECAGSTEFWGQSYGNADGQGPGPVVAGNRGVWLVAGGRTAEVRSSAPTNCSGDTPAVPVRTRYTFFDSGAAADKVRIERTWSFAANQQNYAVQGLRAYVPRLPLGTYSELVYPNAAGDDLVRTNSNGPTVVSDWNRTWLAVNAPGSQSGVLILRDPADLSPASIVADNDASSGSNNSGITLDNPGTGWKAPLTEVEYLCFYDEESWPPASRTAATLPAGCSAATVPINTAVPVAGPGAAAPRAGESFTATPGTWDNAAGAFGYQWLRCAAEVCASIPGAASATYTATAADVGKSLRIQVTATAPGGEADTADSNIAGTISGTVYEDEKAAGHELGGAPVTVCRLSGSPCRLTTADGNGFYRLQAPATGNYRATAYPPAGSKAIARTRTTIIRTRAETEKSGQDIVLPLPKLPPPEVNFSGPGTRAQTAEGVPVVHWQEPFVLEYEAKGTSEPEVTIEFGNGQKVRVKPRPGHEPSPIDPEKDIFLFDFPPLAPNHGAALVSIGAGAGSPAEEQGQEEEEAEEEEQEEEEEDEEEEPEEEEESPEEEEETEEEEEGEEQEEEATEEEAEEEEDEEPIFPIYIDPSGFVRTVGGAPLGGATVILFEATSVNGPFTVVPNGSAAMSPMNRVNPDLSEADGHFGWDVVAGFYRVRVQKSGCNAPGAPGQATVETGVLTIPPPVTNLDLRLECPAAPAPPGTPAPPGEPTVSPPPSGAPTAPRLRVALTLPAKAGAVKVAAAGTYKVKAAKLGCPAASPGSCTVTVTAKAKKAALGTAKLTVAPGKVATLAGKLSAAGLRKLKYLGKLKAKLSVNAAVPGGDSSSGVIAANLVRGGKR